MEKRRYKSIAETTMTFNTNQCVFCGMMALIRGHHIVPKSVGGKTIVPTCEMCESFIHKNWSHKELRDSYNTVESILENEKFQKFLKWRVKQPAETVFKSKTGKFRDRGKYS
jgi:hypothetical protein